jgi:hypothetical protein
MVLQWALGCAAFLQGMEMQRHGWLHRPLLFCMLELCMLENDQHLIRRFGFLGLPAQCA